MKMNKIDGSRFPSSLFSRFRRPTVPEAESNNETSIKEEPASNIGEANEQIVADAKVLISDTYGVSADNQNEPIQTEAKDTVDVKSECGTEIQMLEFGIDYRKESKDIIENARKIEDVEINSEIITEINTEKKNETIEIPAVLGDIVNAGSSINTVDPLKILDQLGSIHKKRTKRHR